MGWQPQKRIRTRLSEYKQRFRLRAVTGPNNSIWGAVVGYPRGRIAPASYVPLDSRRCNVWSGPYCCLQAAERFAAPKNPRQAEGILKTECSDKVKDFCSCSFSCGRAIIWFGDFSLEHRQGGPAPGKECELITCVHRAPTKAKGGVMYRVYVDNHIDYGRSTLMPDGVTAFFWAVAQLLGPCRSGNAYFQKVSGS